MKASVVGGGLAGLIASVELAERGVDVTLYERSSRLGGRARTSDPPYVTNLGPHALYADGALWAWLRTRGLLPPTRRSNPLTVRFVWRGRLRRTVPRPVVRAMLLSLRAAPAGVSFRAWAGERVPEDELDACCRTACFFTFEADPGRLSARFVNERHARLVRPPSPARFVSSGGWQAIVDAVADAARRSGVDIRLGQRVDTLPPPPVVVATEPAAASALLGVPLDAPRTEAVLLDVAVTRRRGEPSAVIDLDGGAFIERYTAFDRALAPDGEELLQCHAGLPAGAAPEEALNRIETALDRGFAGWRGRERWRAVRRSRGRTGAVELPGAAWEARPAVEQAPGVHLAGDWVAAPGLLSEVAVTSAVRAAAAAATAARAPAVPA